MLIAINDLPGTLSKNVQAGQTEYEPTRLARAYAELEKTLHLPEGTLKKDLPGFATDLLERTGTPPILRSKCLFVLKRYAEAESEALKAHREAMALKNPRVDDAVESLNLAGECAREQIHYPQALKHFLAAADLTSRERNILQWLDVQNAISYLYYLQGRYIEGLANARQAWHAAQQAGMPEDSAVLAAHMYFASALDDCGESALAEIEYREVILVQEHALGREHRETLQSRSYLAEAMRAQGKFIEADQEHSAVLQLRTRLLGVEDPDTLKSRMNLAKMHRALGRPAQAEKEHREVVMIKERVLGPEHPDTLKSRMGVASALYSQDKFAEAEKEYRTVLEIQERVLGAEHPDLALSCYDLGLCIESQKKLPEALVFVQRAEQVWTKSLGPGHPDTKDAMADRLRIEDEVKQMKTR